MSMRTQCDRDANGNIIVHMQGDLSHESTLLLHKGLKEILKTNSNVEVILNMQNIDFVGSSGIGQFAKTLKVLNQEKFRVKIKNVRPEFIKAFQLYELSKEDLVNLIEDFEQDDIEIKSTNHFRATTPSG